MKPVILSPEAIASALTTLEGWELQGAAITKLYRFPTYLAGIDFVVALAKEAEAMNHHPDLHVGWRKVGVTLSTHSAGGVTELDVELARRAEGFGGTVKS